MQHRHPLCEKTRALVGKTETENLGNSWELFYVTTFLIWRGKAWSMVANPAQIVCECWKHLQIKLTIWKETWWASSLLQSTHRPCSSDWCEMRWLDFTFLSVHCRITLRPRQVNELQHQPPVQCRGNTLRLFVRPHQKDQRYLSCPLNK